MKNLIWKLIAYIVSRPLVYTWLIDRAQRTPYLHLEGYMNRWWLFNPYWGPSHWPWLPSVRIHHILRADEDRHPHSHPWDARTIILYGSYAEERLLSFDGPLYLVKTYKRQPGDIATLKPDDYHRITDVSPGGVWTLFITWKYQGTWGYLVDGVKVPHRLYRPRS